MSKEELKPLTLEETTLKEEMKARCLIKGQYIDEKAKDKFNMLCHLEDFEVQYFELQQENKALKEQLKQLYRELSTSNMSEEEWLDYAINYNLEQLEKRCLDE